MKILVTGSSKGIGKACVLRYLELGHEVYGLDLLKSSIDHHKYHHYQVDISEYNDLPDIKDIEIVFNNAGKQNSEDDIKNNLVGAINVTKKYVLNNHKIKSVLFNASASARSSDEFPEYVASKAGIVGYMKNVAIVLAKYNQATVNSISFGGVLTESNNPVIKDKKLFSKIMEVTPLKKWMSEEECADWVMFLTLTNKSMSGQDILIDNGEHDLNSSFVWPN